MIPANQYSSESIASQEDETEDGFVLIEDSDYCEVTDLTSYPWLDVNHPLYFPATQTSNPQGLTRWDAVDKFSVENWYVIGHD